MGLKVRVLSPEQASAQFERPSRPNPRAFSLGFNFQTHNKTKKAQCWAF